MRKMREEAIGSLIKKYEGYKETAYLCPAGVWTLGYGSTIWLDGNPVKRGMTCTRETADQVLRRDIKSFEEWCDNKIVKQISVRQRNGDISMMLVPQWLFEANVSLCYNIGMAAWAHSTELKKLNAGAFIKVA